jgi:hypothetical protein
MRETMDGMNSACFSKVFPEIPFFASILIAEEAQDNERQEMLAWTRETIGLVLKFLSDHGYAIAELNIYGRSEHSFFLIDSSVCEYKDVVSWHEYCRKSKVAAERNIKSFAESGQEIYFVPLPMTEYLHQASRGLPTGFPKEMLYRAKPLEEPGVVDVAWSYEDALWVIEMCYQAGYAVLGGEVYHLDQNRPEVTYDSWYIDQKGQCWDAYLVQSKEAAVTYISNYAARNGSHYCYTFTIKEGS